MAHAAPPQARKPVLQPAALDEGGDKLRWKLAFPLYVRDGVDAYMQENPGNSVATVVLRGFEALGIAIDPPDLVPERAARAPRKRQQKDTDDLDTLKTSSFDFPRYVRTGVEAYMRQNHGMGIRNVAMAGLAALGIPVREADLATQKPNILTHGNRTPIRRGPARAPATANASPAAQRRTA